MRPFVILSAALLVALAAGACFGAAQPTPPVPSSSASPSATTTAAARRVCPPAQQLAGAITGKFSYPSESAPPLAIYAIRVDAPGSYRVVHTAPIVRAPASTTYTMLAVEPGTYVVVASAVDASGRPTGASLSGAYTPAVACGLTASCTDHAPIKVTVRSGQTTPNVNVFDWYAPAGSFPAPPTGGEPFTAGDHVAVCNPFADEANLRNTATTASSVVRTLTNGIELVVTDGPRPADGYDWYAVAVESSSGWVVGYALRR